MQYWNTMKKTYVLLAFAALFMLTGCDFLRKMAGRPTSDVIEARRLEIIKQEKEAEIAREQARLDSIIRLQQEVRDSIAALDSIRQQGGTVLNPTNLGGLFSTKLEARYYVVVGAFRSRANAEGLLKRIKAEGEFSPALINFRNGMIAVGVCPQNRIQDASASMKEVKTKSFCPADVWILVNE